MENNDDERYTTLQGGRSHSPPAYEQRPDPIPSGTTGTVRRVDRYPGQTGEWQISVNWDIKRSLALAYPQDQFEIIGGTAMRHDLIPAEALAKLLENGRHRDQDHAPVVKLFTPDGGERGCSRRSTRKTRTAPSASVTWAWAIRSSGPCC